MNEYDHGDTVTLRCDFKVDDALTDPTTVTLEVTDPSGNMQTYTYAGATITRDSIGRFSKAIAVNESGEWVQRWIGTGACAAVGSKRFAVRRAGA